MKSVMIFGRLLSGVRAIRDGNHVLLRHWARKYWVRLPMREISSGFWAIPAVVTMRALRPLVLIRLGTLNSTRIGHFVADGLEQIALLNQQEPNVVDLFWLGKSCNSQWDLMIRRSLPIFTPIRYVDWWNRVIPGGQAHFRPSSHSQSRDIDGRYATQDLGLPFLPEEEDIARTWLRRSGWKDGEPFVCLLVRDDAYLATDEMHGSGSLRAYDSWAYHSYRNSDIESYSAALKWLSDQGVWVIRMGKRMAKPVPLGLDRVIDYAFDPGKTDLLDVWLFASCSFCISTASGPDVISMAYRRPVLFVNALPIGGMTSFAHCTWIPKHLVWKATGSALTLKDHLDHTFYRSSEYEAAGIQVIDLSSQEILECVQRFWKRLQGDGVDDVKTLDAQTEYWKVFEAWSQYSDFHKWRHPKARIELLDYTNPESSCGE